MAAKKSLLTKTLFVSIILLLSKFIGILRELLQVNYLGVGELSDAFNTAFKIPQTLRKVFAEGALSTAFIPTIIHVMKKDSQAQADKLMSLMYLVFGSIIVVLCLLVSLFPKPLILLYAVGYASKPVELETTIRLLRTLIYFVFFIFSSSLLAGALQSKMHFALPSWGPALLNLFYITGLLSCIYWKLDVSIFSYFLIAGAVVQTVLYLYAYFFHGFTFLRPDRQTVIYFKQVLYKFLPALVTVSAVEINSIIDNRYASLLPAGSITLLNLSSRFMGIALGAFAVAFSQILLSHFSRISAYAPKRLSFYLFESTKLIVWVTLPVVLLMSFFSYDIFYTIFYKLSHRFTLTQVEAASKLLIAFLPGLIFLSLNKVLISIYSSLHELRYATAITFIGVLCNIFLNRLLVPLYGATGIAIATSLASILQTVLLIKALHIFFGFSSYYTQFFTFFYRYSILLTFFSTLFYILYRFTLYSIAYITPAYYDFLVHHIGLWLWVGPLCLILAGLFYLAYKQYGSRLYFFEQ
ncbi:murein biosynthesis integral membrane protein MurJ [Candidatus Dependentiae bacterium]|nr:murein biosynthesis integral membrane protein MurJ [Candidatus Dependentiae bacterium]